MRRDELRRLRELGVSVAELGGQQTMMLFDQFVREFVAPEDFDRFFPDVDRRGLDQIPRWIRPDRMLRTKAEGCLAWLGEETRLGRCVRFDKHLHFPALEIDLATMNETWAAAWPGVFVSFESRRALVITVDYEVLRCDRGAGRTSPYR